MFEKVFGCSEL